MLRKHSRMLSLCLTGTLLFSAGLTLSAKDPAGEKTKTAAQENAKTDTLEAELQKDYQSAASRKQLEFEIKELNADQLRKKAEEIGRIAAQSYQGGEYKKSIDYYLKALSLLKELSQKTADPVIEQKIANCKQAVSNAYFYWAEKLYFDAQKSADAKQYTLAIKNCETAAKIWPPAKPKLDEAIALYRKYQKSAEYQSKVSPDTIDPGRAARQYSIDVLLKQGEVFVADKQWDKARDKYEDVLAVDPFNVQAIEAIRLLNIRMLREGNMRTTVTRAEFIAETLWKEIAPLIPRITGSGNSAEVENPIVKESQKNSIQNKLKTIIIPHIDFDEIELPVVLRYLRQRSKELDPEKTGVNIFLLPEENKEPTANNAQQQQQQKKKSDDDDEEEGETPSSGLKITFQGENMTLGQALTYICNSQNLRMKVEKYSVVIAPPGVPLEQMETRIYPMEKDVIARQISQAAEGKVDEAGGTQINAQSLFTNIPFDEAGAQVIYDASISRLIVTNTADNLQKVEEMIKEMNVVDPQILIQAKFVEVQLNDLEELGFEYLFSRQNSNIAYAKKEDLVQYNSGDPLPDYTINIFQPQNSQERKLGPSADWYKYSSTYTKGKDTAPTGTFYYQKAPVQSKSVSFQQNNVPLRTVKDMPSHESAQDILAQFTHYNKYGYKVQATVTALDQADSTDLLACPRITTMNGYETMIAMVTEAYYPNDWNEAEVGTLATGGGSGSVPMITPSIPKFDSDPERLGIELRVKPQVDATDNYTITMPIQPVIRTFVGWVDYSYQLSTQSNGEPLLYTNILKMPIFDNRSIDTLIQCYDGETVVLGGVMKDQTTSFNDQYPILGNLPLIGRLFQSKAKSAEKTNLLIFLTCRLINPDGSPVREREMRGLPPFRQ